MGPDTWVTTIIHCARHNRDGARLCVRVDREVPGPLRCSPSYGGGVGGGVSPMDCPCGGRYDVSDLGRRVADALRRGVGEWIKRGAVVISA